MYNKNQLREIFKNAEAFLNSILQHLPDIRLVHVRNEILYPAAFFQWNGSKVRFCYIGASAEKQINRIPGCYCSLSGEKIQKIQLTAE